MARPLVEHSFALSVRELRRDRSRSIAFTTTPQPTGGARLWALCPGCGRRAGFLYLVAAGALACRLCAGLVYACQRETDLGRAIRAERKIRGRLRGGANILEPLPPRPPHMKRRTYERLCGRALLAMSAALESTHKMVDKLERRNSRRLKRPQPQRLAARAS